MNTKFPVFTGLFLIIALIMIVLPVSAATQTYLDPGYSYNIGHMESGAWQTYDLDVSSTDDYDILALVFSHACDFDLYVVDPTTGATITSATAPYSTENGLDYIWAVSTIKPGKYSVRVHSNSGAGNFAFIHFYNRQPIQRTVGTTTTVAPTDKQVQFTYVTQQEFHRADSSWGNKVDVTNNQFDDPFVIVMAGDELDVSLQSQIPVNFYLTKRENAMGRYDKKPTVYEKAYSAADITHFEFSITAKEFEVYSLIIEPIGDVDKYTNNPVTVNAILKSNYSFKEHDKLFTDLMTRITAANYARSAYRYG